ncbi:MAG: glutamine synthetase III [Akkermansia sp.]
MLPASPPAACRTFEARGYTAWDPTSPAFIKRHGNGPPLHSHRLLFLYGDALTTPLCSAPGRHWATPSRADEVLRVLDERVTITLGPNRSIS